MSRRRSILVAACAVLGAAGLVSCGGDTMGVATTVVNVTPTNFATIPPVASTAPGTTTTLPPNAIGEGTTYVVKQGDTPLGVAGRYNVSLATLLAYNGWVTSQQFPYPGETIKIPPQAVIDPTQPTQPPSGGTGGGSGGGAATTGCGNRAAGTYKVQSNDSLYKIRDKFCVSIAALLSANGWADSGVTILPGDVINIPAAGS